ncbi:hypothetical protein E1281_29555 [Actinomadura sp. KC345]|uniref:hypothetical protein n=1 Tax=Actinomadura sp. KC345 TaxID=2530371 RepID=UPI0010429DF3|nr:hypothetical protein [Actinomadura sp. KC345]TDC45754.1 hypothetical protein E1281_29555 [Actinomadura sp. KC345]
MNLNDRQRKLLFGGLVVVLAAIGVYLTIAAPGGEPDRPDARPEGAPATSAPASPPPGIEGTIDPGEFDIYRLLPFNREEFANAGDLARRFVAAYGTYRFDEPPQTYTGRLSGLVTEELMGQLERDAATPGILEERRREQVVAESTATLDQVRNIEANSIVFVVSGRQKVTEGGGESSESKRYAVTVAREGGSLRVYAFQPADVGQAGDTG